VLEGRRNGGGMQAPVLGVVTNLDDPDRLGRVKVKIPSLGEGIESWWARLVVPGGGQERGLWWSPEINDEVLVVFEYGDVHRPLVIGGLWSNPNKPPVDFDDAIGNGKVNQRVFKTRVGHTIILDDTDGMEQIVIRDKTGVNEIVIDSAANTLTMKAEADIVIEALGNMTLKSTGDMNLEGNNVNVKATTNGKFEATAGLDVTATGQLNLKGASAGLASDGTTEVKSTGMVKVQGPMIMLN
jgi:uncharacterized protein involved in type VI secretion and phage assembly